MTNARQWLMRLGPAAISVYTHLPLDEAFAELAARGEPALYQLTVDTEESTSGACLVHVPTAVGRASAAWDAARAILTVRAAPSEISGEALLHQAYLLLESRLQEHGYVTLHAAAAVLGRSAVLLLGPAGAGKTTTLLRLCRDHGAMLAGNDLVVAGGPGEPIALAGSQHVRLRHASVSRAMPELLGLFPSMVGDPWREKRVFDPARLGIAAAERPAPIRLVAFVHVDVDYEELVDEPGDTLVHRLNLHENAARYIRGASTPWLIERAYGPYVPVLDDPLLHAARSTTLQRLMQRSRYIAGPPAEVAERLAHRLSARVGRNPLV